MSEPVEQKRSILPRCEQAGGCETPALARMFWPGREPTMICLDHAAKAQRIADAMGFYLCIEEL